MREQATLDPLAPAGSAPSSGVADVSAKPLLEQLDRVIFGALLVFVLFLSRIAMAQIALGVALIAWSLRRRVAPGPLVWPTAILPASVFALLTLASACFSLDPSRSLPHMREFVLFGILFLVPNALSSRRQVELLLHGMLAAALVLGLWGVAQYVLWQGGTEHRIRGPLSHWMTYAGLVTFATTLAIGYAAYHPCRRRRVAYAGVAVFLSVVLALTLTRGAYLAVTAALGLALLMRKPGALMLLPIALGLAFLIAPSDVRTRVLSSTSGEDDTTVDRLYLWRSGLRMIGDHPVFGLGLSMVNVAYEEYRDPNAPKRRNMHLHDNVIQIAAERGLPALLCWIWMFVALGRGIVRRFREADAALRPAAAGILLSFVAFHVLGIGEYNFGDSEILMASLFLFALPDVMGTPAAGVATPVTPAGGAV